ncbi:DNA polymerase Y family protein [Streptomyces sp. NPDC051572]|uniref:DNA polymerase Y family protein n=1 Tax=Streptomyces sp. NPDC051572 TaxID=3155802 RepID=UPI00344CB6BA
MVVWALDWPLVAAEVHATEPVAVTAAGRIVACTAAARAAGVRRGMRIRQAVGLLPELRLKPRDPAGETRAFEPLLHRFEHDVVARLEVLRPGLVALPVRGPARYWGGEEPLAVQLHEAAAALGIDCRMGAADTVFAAALAARRAVLVPPGATPGFLSDYGLGVLGRPALADLLVRLGVRTLGAFAALPSGSVLARFGPDGAAAHRLARGVEDHGLGARPSSDGYQVEHRFDPAETRLEAASFTAKALAVRLHHALEEAGLVCARIEVRARMADGRTLARVWRHEGGLSDLAVAERLRWQLQAWQETGALVPTAAGGEGIAVLELVPEHLAPAPGQQQALFGTAAAQEVLGQVAARLQALFGHRAVTRAEEVGGRGPADRIRRVPFGDFAEPGRPPRAPWAGQLPAPHPARVFPTPLPARLLDEAGNLLGVSGRGQLSAAPARLTVGGGTPAPVVGWAGPWPLDEDWWQPGQRRRLARLQTVTDDGRAWLLNVRDNRWWAEALYA